MLARREFLLGPAGMVRAAARLSSNERVNRALRGQDVDRPPFTFFRSFGGASGERLATATLDFHQRYRTDLVKVMNDSAFPAPPGKWYELRVDEEPFPGQVRALELIRSGLAGRAYFVETLFNPWYVAEKLSSPEEVLRLKEESPGVLLHALEAIAESEANHVRKALAAGASGIFLAILNAQEGILSPAEYARFSRPFDQVVLGAAAGSPLNILHLHGDKVYFEPFIQGPPAAAINYSTHATGAPIADLRRRFDGVIMGGVDEVHYRDLTEEQFKQQARSAREAAGKSFILAPGCSLPSDTAAEELARLPKALGA
jgi:uroporphyrinogen decarboxylase